MKRNGYLTSTEKVISVALSILIPVEFVGTAKQVADLLVEFGSKVRVVPTGIVSDDACFLIENVDCHWIPLADQLGWIDYLLDGRNDSRYAIGMLDDGSEAIELVADFHEGPTIRLRRDSGSHDYRVIGRR